jgi:hypothetical protein
VTNLPDKPTPFPSPKGRLLWGRILSYAVVVLSTAFMVMVLNPKYLWNTNTVGGGDSGGTLLAVHYTATSLLPHLKVTGWSNWWFLGFPAYVFYFPLPAVVTSLVGYVVGFNMAAHWCLMGPAIALPAAMYFFGRMVRLVRPIPELLCVAAIGYLLEPTWAVSGGNLISLFVGEYSYAWAIPVGLIALGLLWRSINTSKYRGWAALALAATVLCHIVVGIAVGIIGVLMFAVVLLAGRLSPRERRRRVAAGLLASVVGAGLTTWWLLPFVAYTSYSNTVGWNKNISYGLLLMPGQLWLLALAIVGIVFAVTRGWRAVQAVSLAVLMFAGLFIYLPQSSPIWNERFYPLYVLFVWVLGAVGAGALVMRAREILARRHHAPVLRVLPILCVTIASLTIVTFGWAATGWAPLGATPPAHELDTNNSWFHATSPAYYRLLANTALGGVQANPSNAYVNKLYSVLEKASAQFGCGTVLGESLPQNEFSTSYPWGLLSVETNGCLNYPEGPFLESSVTQYALSATVPLITYVPSSGVQEGVDTSADENLTTGVQLMQELGIKYYMAYTAQTIALAAKQSDLKLISHSKSSWHVYLVEGSSVVSAALYQPLVLTGPGAANDDWGLTGVDIMKQPGASALTAVQSGVPSWSRLSIPSPHVTKTVHVHVPALKKEPSVTITKYKTTNDTISFHVSRVGVPIDIKTSYFPNWHVIGAPAIYRSVPNFMVVVPTSKNVTLYYGQTGVDKVGDYATDLALLGLVGLFILDWRTKRTDWLEEFPANFKRDEDDSDTDADTTTNGGKTKLLQRRFLSFEGTSRKPKKDKGSPPAE